ncbi:ABC transporter permease [Bordetella pertussis]|uniref:ABC transporter permease n=1 Tax=Bordetella pertussis TaxID=520 RepID=UPI0039B482A3
MDRAAESLRYRRAGYPRFETAARQRGRRRQHALLAGYRWPGARCAVGHHLWHAHQPDRWHGVGAGGVRHRRHRGPDRGVLRRPHRRVADAHRGYPAFVPGHSGGADLLAILGKGVDKVIIALVVVQWAYFARAARGAALVERGKEYVEAARCLSLGWGRVLLRHVLPNCMPPLIVIATIDLAHAIALEATLSFLGVGVPVTEPSLGMLIANGFEYLLSGHYWISFFPGIALAIAIIAINLVGDHLRDVLNPRNAG